MVTVLLTSSSYASGEKNYNPFHRETQKPLWTHIRVQGGFGHNNPGFLVAASSHGSQYEIVIGYVELLPIP